MVNVYNEYGDVEAQVKYSENLDWWDGSRTVAAPAATKV